MADSNKSEITLGYRITKILSTKFSFSEIDETILDTLLAENGAGININLSTQIDKNKSSITIDVNSTLFNSADNSILVEHTGRTTYFVQGLETTFNDTKNAFDLPNALLVQIYGIAYTHSRALLASDLSSTCYREKYFLPVINPTELIKQNLNG